MFDFIYETLSSLGYTHPLHPLFTHVTIGLTVGAFVFALGGKVSRGDGMLMCARYCVSLALVVLIPTVLLGYMDWQHFFGGAWRLPFKAKLGLAGALLILLIVTGLLAEKAQRRKTSPLFAYFLCFLCVAGLGYFGGELVYGKPFAASEPASPEPQAEETTAPPQLALEGAEIFSQNCAMCHAVDTTEEGIGPGLKGLFNRDSLPVSGRAVSEEAVRTQVRDPFENMPPFQNLTDPQIDAIIAYLKTV